MCTPWMTIKISVVHYTNNLFKTYLILLNVYVLYSCALYSYTLHSFNYLGKDNLLTSWVLMLILSWLNAQKVAYHFDPLGPEGQGTGRFGRVFFRRETCGWSVITVTWPSPFKGKHTGAKKKCGWIPLDTLGGKFSNLKKKHTNQKDQEILCQNRIAPIPEEAVRWWMLPLQFDQVKKFGRRSVVDPSFLRTI